MPVCIYLVKDAGAARGRCGVVAHRGAGEGRRGYSDEGENDPWLLLTPEADVPAGCAEQQSWVKADLAEPEKDRQRSADSGHSREHDRTTQFDPKPSSNHAGKLAARVVTRDFP
jgi:hypothetical protein